MNIEDIEVKKDPIIVFMGTPKFAAVVLNGLLKDYRPKFIVTQPDKPYGRKQVLKPSCVKEIATKENIVCLQPNNLDEILQEVNQLQPDLIITCAYGKKLPLALLAMPKLGCINVHASLLPKLRGGAPIQRAIMNGDEETGVTIMYMSEGMDEGDIISQEAIKILPSDTGSLLEEKLSILGRDLLLKTLPSILKGTNGRIKQKDDDATYGFIIKKEDEKIIFGHTKRQIVNQIRALNDHPGAYCILDGKRLKVWEAYRTDEMPECAFGMITKIYDDGFGVRVGNGEVVFTMVQLEGKGIVTGKEFICGHKDLVGKVLK